MRINKGVHFPLREGIRIESEMNMCKSKCSGYLPGVEKRGENQSFMIQDICEKAFVDAIQVPQDKGPFYP